MTVKASNLACNAVTRNVADCTPGACNGSQHGNTLESERIRAKIVKIAKSLLDSPYIWNSVQPYKGSHCAMCGLTPYKLAGCVPEGVQLPTEHRDWLLGKNVDPVIFRRYITQFGAPVAFDDRQTADLVTFLYNGIESHCGIIVQMDPDYIIHNPSGGTVRFQRLLQVPSLKTVYRANIILELEANGR